MSARAQTAKLPPRCLLGMARVLSTAAPMRLCSVRSRTRKNPSNISVNYGRVNIKVIFPGIVLCRSIQLNSRKSRLPLYFLRCCATENANGKRPPRYSQKPATRGLIFTGFGLFQFAEPTAGPIASWLVWLLQMQCKPLAGNHFWLFGWFRAGPGPAINSRNLGGVSQVGSSGRLYRGSPIHWNNRSIRSNRYIPHNRYTSHARR